MWHLFSFFYHVSSRLKDNYCRVSSNSNRGTATEGVFMKWKESECNIGQVLLSLRNQAFFGLVVGGNLDDIWTNKAVI